MPSRHLRFFMRVDEFTALVWEQAERFGLSVIVIAHYHATEVLTTPGTIVLADGTPPWRLYLAPTPPATPVLYDEIQLSAWGWVECFPPSEQRDELTMTTLRAWSWTENRASLALFQRIRTAFRKHLTYPMWAYNTHMPDSSPSPYRDIAYSAGAASWCLSGRLLRETSGGWVGFSVDEYIHEPVQRTLSLPSS